MRIFPSLEKVFIGYGSYHNNPINKAIHIVCIPLIVISILQISNHYSFKYDTPLIEINFALVALTLLSLVYIQIDLACGIIAAIFYFTTTLMSNQTFKSYEQTGNSSFHLKVNVAIHIVSWILQFIGHGVFESFKFINKIIIERAPALLDNILQVFAAPFFVVVEVLFMLGFRKETHQTCQKQINKRVLEYKNQKKRI